MIQNYNKDDNIKGEDMSEITSHSLQVDRQLEQLSLSPPEIVQITSQTTLVLQKESDFPDKFKTTEIIDSQTTESQDPQISSSQVSESTIQTQPSLKYYLDCSEVTIQIDGFQFNPSELFVRSGTKVTWQVQSHNSEYNSLNNQNNPVFYIIGIPQLEKESQPIHENESFSLIIETTGIFTIQCSNYTSMKGQLVVVDKSITLEELIESQRLQQSCGFFKMDKIEEFKQNFNHIDIKRKGAQKSIKNIPRKLQDLKNIHQITSAKESDTINGNNIEKQSLNELEDQSNNLRKRRNHNNSSQTHYLQLHKEDFKEAAEDDQDEDQEAQSNSQMAKTMTLKDEKIEENKKDQRISENQETIAIPESIEEQNDGQTESNIEFQKDLEEENNKSENEQLKQSQEEEYFENDQNQKCPTEDQEDTQYDCNTIISEEDQQSTHSSKESSYLQRMINSTNNIHSPTDYEDEDDYDDGSASCRSFTVLACSDQRKNKQFGTKRHSSFSRHQIYRSSMFPSRKNKNNLRLFADNYLKSPAQSILTTAESSKYSDTTKQPSQKGDFDMEAVDIRGGLYFQHKFNQKRRASTDQIQESRYHNQNNGLDDSDTRSIKSLKNEPLSQVNPPNSNGSSEQQQQYSVNGVPVDGMNIPITALPVAESDNENECTDIFMNYDINKFKKTPPHYSSRSKSRETYDDIGKDSEKEGVSLNPTSLQNFIKQQNLYNRVFAGRSKERQTGKHSDTSRESVNGNDAELQYPKLISNGRANAELINDENKRLEELNINSQLQGVGEKLNEEINFIHSFLQQRYEIESWLLDMQEENGDTEEY